MPETREGDWQGAKVKPQGIWVKMQNTDLGKAWSRCQAGQKQCPPSLRGQAEHRHWVSMQADQMQDSAHLF